MISSILVSLLFASADLAATKEDAFPEFNSAIYCQAVSQSKDKKIAQNAENCEDRESGLREAALKDWVSLDDGQRFECAELAAKAVGSYSVLWQCQAQAKMLSSIKTPIDMSQDTSNRLVEIEKREHALGLAPPCFGRNSKETCSSEDRVWLHEKLNENEEFTVDGKIRKINPEIVSASNNYNDFEGEFPPFDSDAHCAAISLSSDPKIYKTLDSCKWLETTFLPETKEYWNQMNIKQKNRCLAAARGGGGSYFVLYICTTLTLGIKDA